MSLQERNILEKLSPAARCSLMEQGVKEEVAKGTVLFSENDDVDSLYLVLEGYISLYRNSRYGDIKIIFVCTTGEALNETLLEDGRTAVAAKALSEAKVLRINRLKLLEVIRIHPEAAMILFASLSYKTRRLYHQTGNANRTYPMERKLAAKIWKMARDYGRDTTAGRQIGFEITVTMLANMLGAKRETISRDISAMKKSGLIQLEDGWLIVPQMEKLREKM